MFDEGPSRLDLYLRPFEGGAPVDHTGFMAVQDGDAVRSFPCSDMSIVFERAAYYAADENSLDWATIAVRAADLWAIDEDEWNRTTAMRDSMKLRTSFICSLGARSGHPVLDTAPILSWVNEGLTIPLDLARMKTMRWSRYVATEHGLTLAEIRELRDIKVRLHVLQKLADCGQVRVDPSLIDWLSIHKQLP